MSAESGSQGLLARLLGNKLFQKGSSMVIWRAVTLVIAFGTTVWVARCLGPEELGKSGLILATANQIILVLAICPNTYAIRLVKNSDDSEHAISLVVTARAFASLLYLVVILALFGLGMIPAEWTFLVLLGVFIPILLVFQPPWIHQAQENQPAQYKSGAVLALAAFIYAAIVIRPGGVAYQDLTGRLISLVVGVAFSWWMTGRGQAFKFIQFGRLKEALNHAWESRVLFITQIVIYVYIGLELPLLGYLVAVEELGMYRTASQLVMAVNSFLMMVPLLYYPRFIEWQKQSGELLWQQQKKIFFYAVLIVVPVVIAALVVGPWAYTLIFGDEFSAAGIPFVILVCSKLMVVLNGIFAWGLWARSKDLTMLYIFIFVAVFSLVSNLWMIPKFGMMAAASINLLSETWILLIAFLVARREVIKDRKAPSGN